MKKGSLQDTLKKRSLELKHRITVLYYAAKENRISLPARILILITIAYALSPVDLIPDFIPILGYLDDLVILPLLIILTIRIIPKDVMERAEKEARENPVTFTKNWIAGASIILLWAVLLTWAIIFFIGKKSST